MTDETIHKTVIYDKFLIIEGLAYMGKNMVEKGRKEKAIECYNRIVKEAKELEILLKRISNGSQGAEKDGH